jgi:hypothetical protein
VGTPAEAPGGDWASHPSKHRRAMRARSRRSADWLTGTAPAPAVQIGEVAAPAAGNQDLLAGLARMVQHHHAAPVPPGRERAHQAGGAGAQDDDIGGFHDPADVGRRRGVGQGPAPARLPRKPSVSVGQCGARRTYTRPKAPSSVRRLCAHARRTCCGNDCSKADIGVIPTMEAPAQARRHAGRSASIR